MGVLIAFLLSVALLPALIMLVPHRITVRSARLTISRG
jgi:hypothetical protein